MSVKSFQVVGSSKPEFLNITISWNIEDDAIGNIVNVLGGTFEIVQNGKIIGLASKEWNMTMLDVTPVIEPEEPKLKINSTIEVYFDDKVIEVKVKCTYKELYDFLEEEWKSVAKLPDTPQFPLEMRGSGDMLLKDSWDIKGFELITEGSFERQNNQGRSI